MPRKNNRKQTRTTSNDLLNEFTSALRDLDMHRHDYDPADYHRKRDKIIVKAEQYFSNLVN